MTTATPADVSLLMQLGVDGVFVGSGIFKSNKPKERAHAMVQAVTHYKDAAKLAEVSENLGVPMVSMGNRFIFRFRRLSVLNCRNLGTLVFSR